MDYSVSWKYIVQAMEEKGIAPDSEEKHEFGFFERKMKEVWEDYFNRMYAMEQEVKSGSDCRV